MQLVSNSIPPIDSEEIGFALCLFVESIEGRLDFDLGYQRRSIPVDGTPQSEDVAVESPVRRALAWIWKFYGADLRRADICARVAAFYSLMSLTEGEGLGEWITDSMEEPGHPILDAAIVEAIATIPLSRLRPYDMDCFAAYVRQMLPSPENEALKGTSRESYELTMPCTKA